MTLNSLSYVKSVKALAIMRAAIDEAAGTAIYDGLQKAFVVQKAVVERRFAAAIREVDLRTPVTFIVRADVEKARKKWVRQ